MNLPLWNKEQTDLHPEYFMSYGNAIIFYDGEINKILGFGRPIYSGGVDRRILDDYLNRDGFHNVLSIKSQEKIQIFSDRKMFFSNSRWVNISRELKTIVCVGIQNEENDYIYNVFESGKQAGYVQIVIGSGIDQSFKLNICISPNKIETSKISHTFTFNEALLSSASICGTGSNLYFRDNCSGERIDDSLVRHEVYEDGGGALTKFWNFITSS